MGLEVMTQSINPRDVINVRLKSALEELGKNFGSGMPPRGALRDAAASLVGDFMKLLLRDIYPGDVRHAKLLDMIRSIADGYEVVFDCRDSGNPLTDAEIDRTLGKLTSRLIDIALGGGKKSQDAFDTSPDDILMSLSRLLEDVRSMTAAADRGEVFLVGEGTRERIREAESILRGENKKKEFRPSFELLSRQEARMAYAIGRINHEQGLTIKPENFDNHIKTALSYAERRQDDEVLLAAMIHSKDQALLERHMGMSRSPFVRAECYKQALILASGASIEHIGSTYVCKSEYVCGADGGQFEWVYANRDMAEDGLKDAIEVQLGVVHGLSEKDLAAMSFDEKLVRAKEVFAPVVAPSAI